MTLPHHYATIAISGVVAKPNFFRSKQRGDHYIAAGLQLPSVCTRIRLRRSFNRQHLLRLRQTQLPWNTRADGN